GVTCRDLVTGFEARQGLAPAGARLPAAVGLPVAGGLREGSGPGVEPLLPFGLRRPAAPGDPRPVLADGIRDGHALRGVEAENLLRGAHLGLAERAAVCLAGVDGVRRRIGDVAAQDDE